MVTLQKVVGDKSVAQLNERQNVNLKTGNNISFGRGFIVIRASFFKSNKYFKADDQTPAEEYNLSKSKDLAKNFTEFVEYTVEFSHLMTSNFSVDALGGRDPMELDWYLEVEPFSSFSYSVMRNNILQVCLKDSQLAIRESIIYLKPPSDPLLVQIKELQSRFSNLLTLLNEE